MEWQVRLSEKLTSNCAQHQFSTTWAFEKVWNSLSLISSGELAMLKYFKFPCFGKPFLVSGNTLLLTQPFKMFEELLNKYQKGQFPFTTGDSIYTVCNAPRSSQGIYIQIGITKEGREIILCIGKAGTYSNNEKGFKDQALYGRLTATRGEISAQNYYDAILLGGFSAIRVEWYITYTQDTKHVPAYVESCLLQKYFDQNGQLPPYNAWF